MQEALKILFWWLMFGGSHILGSSSAVRAFFIHRFGTLGFKIVYSLVALATFTPLCFAYFNHRHAGRLLYTSGYYHNLLAQLLMLGAFIVLLQGLVTANPVSTIVNLSGRVVHKARGIQRITRHPQNLSFGLFGLAHLLANPYVGDWLFFGGFVVFGIVSAIHQDRRLLATGTAQEKQFLHHTSAIPFAAIISGRQRLAPGEYHPPSLAVSLVLFILLRLLHPMLFGGFGS